MSEEPTKEEQIKTVLEEIRPFIQADGGDIEFVNLDGNTVNVHRDDGLGLHRGSSQIALVIYSVIENRHLTVLSLAVRSLRGSCPVR